MWEKFVHDFAVPAVTLQRPYWKILQSWLRWPELPCGNFVWKLTIAGHGINYRSRLLSNVKCATIQKLPTRPMTKKELDRHIAEKLLGLVPCLGYRKVWYDRQGAALIRDTAFCQHVDGACYSQIELISLVDGRMGGPPQYVGSSRAALILLRELWKRCDDVVLYSSRKLNPEPVWTVTLYKRDFDNFDMAPVVIAGPCTAPTPELAIGLAAAELTGLCIAAHEIAD